jgi:hypothetical protein
MKATYMLLLFTLLVLATGSVAQDAMKKDSTSCFLIMEAETHDQGVKLNYGNGTTDYFTPYRQKEDRYYKLRNTPEVLAAIINDLYDEGWRLITVTDRTRPDSTVITSIYYFERPGCNSAD